MRRLFIVLLIIAVSVIENAFSADIQEMKHNGSWWVENYGVISAEEDQLVIRAEDVFERVSMASDKTGSRAPRLLVVRSEGYPWAIALKDGSIILTHGALKICYSGGVTEEAGDSRLAFMLGHELAHLSNNDFWHAFAFTAVEEHIKRKEVKDELKLQLEQTGDISADAPESDKFVRTKELQADAYGIISMAIAGYDPYAIVTSDDNKDFFEDWISQTADAAAYDDPRHPGPDMRSEFLRSQLAAVVEIIDYFTFGVNLYQLGRYSDAILLFGAFSEYFPGREVFNNMGLCHYQLAMKFLSSSNEKVFSRFKLSTVSDTETLAVKLRGDRYRYSLKDRIFLQHINASIRYLNLAIDKDPTYLPGRINLTSSLIMAGRYTNAIGMADDALEIGPDNPEVLNNKAVALYLFGTVNNIDTTDNAIRILKEISDSNPGFAGSVYNTAAIQSERGRKVSAQETWKAFLSIETRGPHADRARRYAGIDADEMTIVVPGTSKLKPPIKLGEITGETAEVLNKMEGREFIIGKFTGEMYAGNNIKVLAIDNVVEVVERQFNKEIECEEFKEKHGEPVRVRNNNCGKMLIYSDFAVDVKNGKIKKVIYFEGKQIKRENNSYTETRRAQRGEESD